MQIVFWMIYFKIIYRIGRVAILWWLCFWFGDYW